MEARVDGRVLNYLTVDDLFQLKVFAFIFFHFKAFLELAYKIEVIRIVMSVSNLIKEGSCNDYLHKVGIYILILNSDS